MATKIRTLSEHRKLYSKVWIAFLTHKVKIVILLVPIKEIAPFVSLLCENIGLQVAWSEILLCGAYNNHKSHLHAKTFH